MSEDSRFQTGNNAGRTSLKVETMPKGRGQETDHGGSHDTLNNTMLLGAYTAREGVQSSSGVDMRALRVEQEGPASPPAGSAVTEAVMRIETHRMARRFPGILQSRDAAKTISKLTKDSPIPRDMPGGGMVGVVKKLSYGHPILR